MKSLSIVLFTFWNFLLVAQDCTPWFPFQEKCSFTVTIFNRKDKPTGSVKYTVMKISEMGDSVFAAVNAQLFDKKEIPYYQYNFDVSCYDGIYRAEFSNYINPAMDQAFGNFPTPQANSWGDNVIIPYELKPGLELPDAKRFTSTPIMNIELTFTDRKVVSLEEVETPVKTFTAYKITGKERIKAPLINRKVDFTYYYAEGYGLIKSEMYKKGKLETYIMLTEFSLGED